MHSHKTSSRVHPHTKKATSTTTFHKTLVNKSSTLSGPRKAEKSTSNRPGTFHRKQRLPHLPHISESASNDGFSHISRNPLTNRYELRKSTEIALKKFHGDINHLMARRFSSSRRPSEESQENLQKLNKPTENDYYDDGGLYNSPHMYRDPHHHTNITSHLAQSSSELNRISSPQSILQSMTDSQESQQLKSSRDGIDIGKTSLGGGKNVQGRKERFTKTFNYSDDGLYRRTQHNNSDLTSTRVKKDGERDQV